VAPLSVGRDRVSRLGLIAIAPAGGLGEDLGTGTDALRSTMTDDTLASWKDGPAKRPIVDFVTSATEVDPSLAGEQPYKAIIGKDEAFFEGVATQDPKVVATLLEGFARSWAGTTPGEFDAQVRLWLTAVKQPKFGVPYVKLVYQPMSELLDLLKANDWRVFVCSGGGRDFMRVFAEETWGITRSA
jgi:phosphoglycolate phosphatase-like HAD superfamily hydrolase